MQLIFLYHLHPAAVCIFKWLNLLDLLGGRAIAKTALLSMQLRAKELH